MDARRSWPGGGVSRARGGAGGPRRCGSLPIPSGWPIRWPPSPACRAGLAGVVLRHDGAKRRAALGRAVARCAGRAGWCCRVAGD